MFGVYGVCIHVMHGMCMCAVCVWYACVGCVYMYRVYVASQLSSKPFGGTASIFFLSLPEYLITQQDLESITGDESLFPE